MPAIAVGLWTFFPIALRLSMSSVLGVAASIVSVLLLATYIPTRRVPAVAPPDAITGE
jgi:hypothetical protein